MSTSQDRPWESEPDLVRFEAHGLPCLILRVEGGGHLCGYVQLPEDHPWRTGDLGSLDGPSIDVHGGITYEGAFASRQEGEPPIAEGYWIGFDCAHSGDRCPNKSYPQHGEYRDIGYVTQQTTDLARQAQEILAYAPRFEDLIARWCSKSDQDRDALVAFVKAWRASQ